MNVSVVSFEKGYSCRMQSKDYGSDFVRAVRGRSYRPFVINDDNTVTDTNTGLMWSVKTSEITMNWEDALNYCETSSLAGYTDWRLPHFEELSSILDFTRSPSIDTKFFDIRNRSYWSSSSSSPSYAQTVHYSTTLYCGGKRKDSSIYVRAIRGGQLQLTDHLFITSPRQASFWQVDDIMPITWETQNISGNVRISLSRNAGRDGTYETIAETDNDGAYDWQVTGDISVNCMLKIEPVDIHDRGSRQGLFTIHTYSSDQYQEVELSPVSTTLSEPSLFTLTANYSTSNNSKTNGIEVRFFYNSSLVSFVSVKNVLLPATINSQPVIDSENFDNDVFTDQYIVLAWKSSLSNWPSGSQPVKLADLKFIGLKQGQTSINVRLFDIFDGYDEKSNHADINILKSHPPSIPTIISSSHELGVCKDLETIELSWENHDESIIGYSILWDTNPLSIPEESISITETNTISPALNNANNHYFHISAVNDDVVCLWSKPLHYGPFCIGSNIKISDIPVQTTTINTASEPIEVSITKADYSMLTDVTISFKSDNTEIVPVDNITFNEINGKKYLIIMPTLNIWGSTNITLLAKDDSNYSEKSFLFKVHPFIIDTPENKANISSEEGLNFIRGTVLDASNIINVVEVEIYDTKYRKYLTPEYRWEEFGIFEVPVNNTWEINTMNVFWKSNTIYEITVRFFDETNCDYLVFNDTCLYECESLCEPDCTDEDFGKCGWKCIHEFFESNNCFFQYTSSFGYDIITPSIISCNLPQKTITIGEPIIITGNISPEPGEIASKVGIRLKQKNSDQWVISKPTQSNNSGDFSLKLDCSDINNAGDWIVQTWWDGNNAFEGAISEEQSLTILKGESRITLDVTSHDYRVFIIMLH